jgi:hypothetical protein
VYKFAAPCELNRHYASAEENWKVSTWGSDSFENDDALDWITGFCDAPAKELVLKALSRVAEMDFFDCPVAPECRAGIAAAEVVAALRGAPNPNLPALATECVSRLTIKADSSLVHLALKAVERIKTDSELKELWDESENQDEWHSAMASLEVRLKELDLYALFDVILDEMEAEEATAAGDTRPVSDQPGAPVESAASIEEAYMEDVYQRLQELLPEPPKSGAREGSSPEFDEELYRKLEPLFSAILAHSQKKET